MRSISSTGKLKLKDDRSLNLHLNSTLLRTVLSIFSREKTASTCMQLLTCTRTNPARNNLSCNREYCRGMRPILVAAARIDNLPKEADSYRFCVKLRQLQRQDRNLLRARSHCIKIVRFCIKGFRRIVCITVTLLFWVSRRLICMVILFSAWRGT